MNKPYVYLIDSSIYIFRSWFTLPNTLCDRVGDPVNAVYGFSDFLLNLLEKEQPQHIACAFDQSQGEEAWRNQLYPAYKANRDPTPQDLQRQFFICQQLAELAGIPVFASSHYEADDIIYTLTQQMRRQGFACYIISGDKDLTQLLELDDIWWEYGHDKRLCYTDVYRKFGVQPEQIADLLALAGDGVDNIPGVPGVGLKTAAKLLAKFGTLENLLANINGIGKMAFRGAARVQKSILENQQQARLFRQLTALRHHPEIPETQLARRVVDKNLLKQLFDEIGFGAFRCRRWYKALDIL